MRSKRRRIKLKDDYLRIRKKTSKVNLEENCVGSLKQTEGRNLKTTLRKESSHHYEQTMA